MKNQSLKSDTPTIAALLNELGNVYLKHEEYDQAIDRYKKLIEIEPDNAEALLNLSTAYIMTKQLSTAAQNIFEKTLNIEPEHRLVNQVLGQIYLDAERDDEQAIQVYSNVLKLEPDKFHPLIEKFIHISLKKDNLGLIFNLTTPFLKDPEKADFIAAAFIKNCWEKHKFHLGADFLKKLLDADERRYFKRLLLFNILKASCAQIKNFELSKQDLDIYVHYRSHDSAFNELIDVYLSLALNRIFQKVTIKSEPKEKSPSIEEYELFLSDNSSSNLWDLGLNKNKPALKKLGIDDHSMLLKLDPLDKALLEQQKLDKDQDSIKQIFDRANCFLIIKIDPSESNNIQTILSDSIRAHSNDGDHFIYGFQKKDFYLIFWEDAYSLTQMAETFVKNIKSGQKQVSDPVTFQIVIHTISLTRSDDFRYLFDDLETALAMFPFEQEVLNAANKADYDNYLLTNSTLISTSVKNLIEVKKDQWLIQPSQTIKHPVTQDEISFHKLDFDNELIKLKNGEIKKVGRFKILEPLHQNIAFSSFKAIDTLLERLVVLKILKPDFRLNTNGAKTEQLFLKEARELGKLTHPQIALTYEIGIENNLCFIAREFVEGVPLMKAKSKKSDWLAMLKLVSQIVDVLSFTHHKNIIHGKLKPDNIFKVNQSQEIKLTDFHIPQFNDILNQQEPDNLKSLTYTAPELIENGKTSTQSDIYSLGVLLYELLTGTNPFDDESKQKVLDNIRSKTPPPLTKYNPKLHHDINEMVMTMIEKSAEARFGSMAVLKNKLSEFINDN